MSKDARLRALLATGYFPDELPPPFNTLEFARFRSSIGSAWDDLGGDYPKTVPEIFSSPKLRAWRRDFSIVNPVAQYYLAKVISDNWSAIKKEIAGSYSAEGVGVNAGGSRAIPKPDFNLVRLRHSEIAASYDYVLIADISRFYGTLYTHAIAWALNGKPLCKSLLNTPAYNNLLGAKLDRAVRKGNDNQTLGIPVGPDTSRVLSEIVAVAVDTALRKKLKLNPQRAVRHVDDWFIGFDSLGDAEAAVAVLSAACRDFQLEIHPEKTRCVHVPREIESLWPAALKSVSFGVGIAGQRRSLEHYFSQAFHFATEYPRENVLSFAVSSSRALRVLPANWHTYETYLLKAARTNATTLPSIVQILASYNAWGYAVGKDRIAKLIEDLIRNNAPTAFHAEVAWALFLAKALSITLPARSLKPVTELESSVCALIALDLRSRGLIDGTLNTKLWQASMNDAGLTSNMWLLAYEAEFKGWLKGTTPYVAAHPYFRELRAKNVSFYNTKRNVKDIRKAKPKPPSSALLALRARLAAPIGQTGAPAFAGAARFAGLADYWSDYF